MAKETTTAKSTRSTTPINVKLSNSNGRRRRRAFQGVASPRTKAYGTLEALANGRASGIPQSQVPVLERAADLRRRYGSNNVSNATAQQRRNNARISRAMLNMLNRLG